MQPIEMAADGIQERLLILRESWEYAALGQFLLLFMDVVRVDFDLEVYIHCDR